MPTVRGIGSETASRWLRFQTSFLSPLGVVRVCAAVPVVVAPAGGDLEGLRVQPDAEGHPEGRREHRLGGRGRALGGAVLDRAAAALGKLVELLGREFLPLGGEHPDEVAVPHARLVDLLFGTADRPEEILEDHPFQFLPDLHRGGDAFAGGSSWFKLRRLPGDSLRGPTEGQRPPRLAVSVACQAAR